MGKAPDDIREEIEETRARMGETVEAIGYKADVKSRAKESISNTKDNVVGAIRDRKDRVVESIVGSTDAISGAVGTAAGSVSDGGSQMAQRIGDATPGSDDLVRAGRNAVGVAQENPLGLALGSFAVGFLAGMVVPGTRMENERIGPIADQIKDKAKETGQEALERGKQVAQEAAQVAQESAQDVAHNAQQAVQRTTESVKEQAQRHGREIATSAQENASDVAGSVTGGSSVSS